MSIKIKYQIFVSSTYIDLKQERQIVVEAILSSGNIPAGMELFASDNKSQWEVIKKWIDESDIFVLLLGGRYGTIESDSGLSYTELEYNYAKEKGKPLFALILSDAFLHSKPEELKKLTFEQDSPEKYKVFKERVCSLQSAFCANPDQIKSEIYKSIIHIVRECSDNMTGWIPANKSDFEQDTDFVKLFEKALEDKVIDGGTF